MTAHNLNEVVRRPHAQQSLTKSMEIAARQRTITMFMLSRTEDPFDRDELLVRFNQQGSEFVTARLELLELPLNGRERELRVISSARPFLSSR